MADETEKILSMVADGTISVEEGKQLLEAVLPSHEPHLDAEDDDWDEPDAGLFQDNLGESVREAVRAARAVAPMARTRTIRRVREGRPPRVRMRGFDEKVSTNPKFDQLVQLGMHGIRPEFIKGLKEAGVTDLTFDQVIKAGMFGVDAHHLKAMREAAPELSFGEVVKAASQGVSASFVKEMRERFPDIEFSKIVKVGMHGVSATFFDELEEAGLKDLDIDQVVKLAMFGISPKYVKEMQESGLLSDLPPMDPLDSDDVDERRRRRRIVARLYPLITRDPASGKEMIVTRLECPESGTVLEGRFSLGWMGRLTPEQLDFVGLLLKYRNNLQKLASELGVAYNTARSRLDDIVEAIGGIAEPKPDPRREEVLSKLAGKEISFEDALRELKKDG